jgi:arylsulfatase A
MLMRRFYSLWITACLLFPLVETPRVEGKPPRPNIVVILADDLGYGDVHCYNPQRGKIPTPHIDRLAATGMRFTDAHSSSGVCSPSRYTLLTGRYHWRTRLQAGIVGYLGEPLIAKDRLTIGGLAQQAGYDTACIGKWHLGWNWEIAQHERKFFNPGRGNFPEVTDAHQRAWKTRFSKPIRGGPTTRGFTSYFGTDVPNWPPYCFIDNDRTVGIPSTFLPQQQFKNHLASLPGPALENWPLHRILPTLAQRAATYIRQQADLDRRFLLYLPLTSPHTPLAVSKPWQGKSGLDHAVADFVMETDNVVGQVIQSLNEHHLTEDTLILFTSDNGFAPYVGAKSLEAKGHFPSGPLRGYKGDSWEGGHRVPFIISYPPLVETGSTCSHLVHQADVMATLAELLEVSLPDDTAEDSYNLLPLLRGGTAPIRQHAVSHGSSGQPAVRMGSWKLVYGPSGGGAWSQQSATEPDGYPAQLYNLETDLGETKNLYAQNPEIVKQIIALGQTIVDRGRSTPGEIQTNDVPIDWSRFLEKK